MNQTLLRKLQLEAGGSHYPDINPEIQTRFAELIVAECMRLNSKELSITAIERLLPLYREHFGVAE